MYRAALLALISLTSAWAQVTPLDQPLFEETLIPITCELAKAPSRSDLPDVDKFDLSRIPGTCHYNLWLPKGYLADPARLILQGAGAAIDDRGRCHVAQIKSGDIRVALLMGDTDKNNTEVAKMEKALPGNRLKVFPFTGKHQWAPASDFTQALDFVQGG